MELIEISLVDLPYVPLPPAPLSWELNRESDKDFHEAYGDPTKRAVIAAYWKKQYTKTASLIDTVPPSERTGYLGKTFAKAYRNIIQSWRNKDRLAVALKWSSEMFEKLPDLVDDTDRRRHNKMVAEITSKATTHTFVRVELQGSAEAKAPRFAAANGCAWIIDEGEALNRVDRPDPMFDDIHLSANGVLFIDSSGRSSAFPAARSAIRAYNRNGDVVAESGFQHDIFRLSTSPASTAFATMSSDCCLYVYGEHLQSLFTKDLYQISNEKNHLRCVDVAQSIDRVLYTAVDCVWCVDLRGRDLWAVKMPSKAGWEKVVERVDSSGTNEEIKRALDLLGMAYPFAPEEIKPRYHQLAREWHPDLHPDDPLANERMQKLNRASELLTGEKAQVQIRTTERVYYKQVMYREHIQVPEAGPGFDFEISMLGPGEDWIYAACFSANGGAYLGTYSGRIIEISSTGKPLRTYDIGHTPRRILEVGEYLYIVADTRLYILKGTKLQCMVDIFEKGDLIFGQTGFGLLAPKSFRWFKSDGVETGAIETEHPIRRIYPSNGGVAIETRQHRAFATGIPAWWSDR